MDRERWKQVDRLFEAVLERAAPDRASFLESECAWDRELRAEVESLLAAHDQQDSFLQPLGTADGTCLLPTHHGDKLAAEMPENYRIVRRLGKGGTSEVYLAYDKRLARLVAIKLLARDWAADEDNVRRFHREARAVSSLNHPNIVTIHEIGEWQGRDFIATEFVDGLTLRECIRHGNPPLATVLDIAMQIANALVAAHSSGIAHRDIKPENIIIRPDGIVKVVDFGIAKYVEPRGATGSDTGLRTATGMAIGTAAYMSPEQARSQAVDERTDIWSLGVVLYEMIAGRLPFSGATPTDCIAAILEREPEPLREVRGAPASLQTIISRALAKNRDERYGDAAEFLKELSELRAKLGSRRRISWRFRPYKHRRPRTWAVAGGGAVAALATLSYFGPEIHNSRKTETGLRSETISSLAVLPLANAGGPADTQYFSEGITDSLINDLSEIPKLKVMSGNSVLRFKGRNVDAQNVAKTLGVRAVLTGRVVRSADGLSVSVELVDARDGAHIWGEQYKCTLANSFDVEQNIAREIAERLRLHLSKEEEDRLGRRRTSNPEAYELYLKGHFYWLKHGFPTWRPGSAPDFTRSRDFFQRAIEADPAYALAYAGLGHYYAMSAGNGLMHPEQGWPKAEAAFKRALELDPMLPEARTGLAVVQWIDHRDWAGAERQLRLAIQLNPNIGGGLYPRFLAGERRFDEAVNEGRRAIEFDPLSIRYSSALASVYYYARRYQECVRQYRRALELDQNDVAAHQALGDAYERQGLKREAVLEWRTALVLAGDRVAAAALDRAFANRGFTAAVRALSRVNLQRFHDLTRKGEFVPATEYARAHLRLGHKDQAFEWLAKACDEHTFFVLHLNADPFYDDLRSDPRFQELVRKIRAPD